MSTPPQTAQAANRGFFLTFCCCYVCEDDPDLVEIERREKIRGIRDSRMNQSVMRSTDMVDSNDVLRMDEATYQNYMRNRKEEKKTQ